MKRNLLQGIVFISAIALSSCSLNKLAGTNTTGDDVYFTKAIAGDNIEYADAGNMQQANYRADDDYYYYGDYASRINRFSYLTPFDYDDDFYYSYVPYNRYGTNTLNANYNTSYVADSPYDDFGVYSPYDFGYADVGGYDNFGFGLSYSTFITTGSGRFHHNGNGRYGRAGYGGVVSNPGTASGGSGLAFTRANGGNNANSGNVNGYRGYTNGNNVIYPGRPAVNSNTVVMRNGVNTTRAIRNDNYSRPTQQVDRVAPQNVAPSNTSSSSSSSSSNTSSGGGGRPVRP